jgi:Arc/MetJ-type ribon-helix-helix transcriptional regulator
MMARMQVELSPDDAAIAEALVASGRCRTVEEAVRIAFLALAEEERAQDEFQARLEADPEWMAEVQQKIREGLDDLDTGRVVPADVAIARARDLLRAKEFGKARAG